MKTFPIPGFFNPNMAGEVFPVQYQQREKDALAFQKEHNITPFHRDDITIGLLLVDTQITFCLPPPWGQLFVGGRSGRAAIDDSLRTSEFIYRNLGTITKIIPTLDSHVTTQIFHAAFWVDENGNHPDGSLAPFISLEDILSGKWRVNPLISDDKEHLSNLQKHVAHYATSLAKAGKYKLQIWPYHAMLGSVSHAIVPIIEEALFFHSVARTDNVSWEQKGDNPLTENYSVLQPEVMDTAGGSKIADPNINLMELLLTFDVLVACGQASSHCFAWTMEHLRQKIESCNPSLAKKVYILGDCTSPVVIPGVIDFTDMAKTAFDKLESSGIHIVKSTDLIESWPDSPFA